MEDLRKKRFIEKQQKQQQKNIFLSFIFKYKYKIILFLILILILFFPVKCGYLIGKFISDFLGTLIKNIVL